MAKWLALQTDNRKDSRSIPGEAYSFISFL